MIAAAVSWSARPEQSQKKHQVGYVELGQHGDVDVVTGILDTGEASGVPVIKAALDTGKSVDKLQIIDCPPGSACSVMESVTDADFCILVAEPTAFGFHNFKMVYELVTLLGKSCGVVINKMDVPYAPLEAFCHEQGILVLMSLPYDEKIARLAAEGEIISEHNEAYAVWFRQLLEKIGGVVR